MELKRDSVRTRSARDLYFDTGKFIKSAGHGHKLERALYLIERFP